MKKKQPAPKAKRRSPVLKLDAMQGEVNHLLQNSVRDMETINALKDRIRVTEESHRGIFVRLNALESRQSSPVAFEQIAALGVRITKPGDSLSLQIDKVKGGRLEEHEVVALRMFLAAIRGVREGYGGR